ncbi:hypothetical protein FRC17_004731 [Serendipita sp. 399]|nr:hypothetical protein FRC17_004731 [Serendipita sp. 399]
MQAVLKHLGLVGAALWLLVIAVHTFLVLFYRVHPSRRVFLSTFCGVWSLILVIMLIGPVFHRVSIKGPSFYGNAGLWCWIKTSYPIERYALHYGWQFLSGFISLILYILIFFRLRGNIQVEGWYFSFQKHPSHMISSTTQSITPSLGIRRRASTSSGHMDPTVEPQAQKIARKMMLYPIAYMVLLLPLAVVRFILFNGGTVPKGVLLFTACLLWLNGLVDVILFILTRPSVIADRTFLPAALRSVFGMSAGDGNRNAGHTGSHGPSASETSRTPMSQANGISIRVQVDTEYDDGGGPTDPPSQGGLRSVGLHDTVSSLGHYHGNSSSAMPYNSRRKVSFEDERGHTSFATISKLDEETPSVKEEDEFIQYLQPQAERQGVEVISIGFEATADVQHSVYDGGSTIRHPYNTPSTMW